MVAPWVVALVGMVFAYAILLRKCVEFASRCDALAAEKDRLVVSRDRAAVSVLRHVGAALVEDAGATLVTPRRSELEAAMAAGGSACLSGWGERLVEEAKDPLAVAGWLGGWTDATRGDAPLDLPRHGETGMAYFDRTGRTVRTLGRGRALNAVDWSSWVWSDVEQDWTVPSTAFRSARR